LNFSRLRPKGSIVKSRNGEATGPVGFCASTSQDLGRFAQAAVWARNVVIHRNEVCFVWMRLSSTRNGLAIPELEA